MSPLELEQLKRTSESIVNVDEDDLPESRRRVPALGTRSHRNNRGFVDDEDEENNGEKLIPTQTSQQQRYRSRASFIFRSSLTPYGDGVSTGQQEGMEVRSELLWCLLGCILWGVLAATTGLALGIYNTVTYKNNPNYGVVGQTSSNSSVSVPQSTLETVYQRGYLNCGTRLANSPGFLLDTGRKQTNGDPIYAGIELDLCLALTSAIFNGQLETDSFRRYRIVPLSTTQRWQALGGANPTVDVLFGAKHTLEFDVYETTTKKGYEFSTPYFWETLVWGGQSPYLDCAENSDFASSTNCQQTKVCVQSGTSYETILKSLIPPDNLVSVSDIADSAAQLAYPARCNVVAGDMSQINPQAMKSRGYSGSYQLGTRVFGKEPLAVATRQGDPRFSDFVQWVMQALFFAEENAISQTTAQAKLDKTFLFNLNMTNQTASSTFENMFRNAVSARGSYAELYNLNLAAVLPDRTKSLNAINAGSSPIMVSFPFGNMDVVGPELELNSPTVRAIKQRGFLSCGINDRNGFAILNLTTRTWSGFDVDMCRALAAALFDGESDARVVFTDLPAAQRFPELVQGRVDVLARLTTYTLERDVREPTTGAGLSFAAPYFYDGLTFGGVPPYTDCAENQDVLSPECQNLKVCLLQGTTMLTVLRSLLRDQYISAKLTYKEIVNGLNDGTCNAIAGGFNDVAFQTIRDGGYKGNYSIGKARYSKDPLALTTRQTDPAWSDFVRWVFWSLVYAEEKNITMSNATLMPQPKVFGPLRTTAFFLAVNAVGNYGEVYNRNFGNLLPRAGLQLVNRQNGPMFYSMPGIPMTS